MPCNTLPEVRSTIKMSRQISAVVHWLQRFSGAQLREAPTFDAQFSSGAGNNYPASARLGIEGAFHSQIHAHAVGAAIGMLLAR
jgi:hypothetical protein